MPAGVTYSFDPAKAASNKALHGVDFADARDFDWETALVVEDVRRDYGEKRYVALGMIGERARHGVQSTRWRGATDLLAQGEQKRG